MFIKLIKALFEAPKGKSAVSLGDQALVLVVVILLFATFG